MPSPQELPHRLIDVVVDRPVGQEPGAVGEVIRPPAEHAVELVPHLAPGCLVTRPEDPPDAPLDPLDRLLVLPKTTEAKKRMAAISDTVFLPDARKKKYETLELIKAGRLKAPTLIVWGLNDPSAPVKLGLDLARLIGSVVDRTRFHVINQAGHYVFREHPRELHRLINDFVK